MKYMLLKGMKKGVIAIGILGGVMATSVEAMALSPSSSPLVSKVTIELPYYYRLEGNTVFIGKTACEKLINEDSKVKITYSTKINTLLTPALYDGIFSFQVARNSTARIDCSDRTAGLCSEVEGKYIKQEAKQVVVNIPFKELAGLSSAAACDNLETELFVRADLRTKATDKTVSSSDAKFVIDSVGPSPPTLDAASSTESTMSLEISGTPSKSTENYAVFYSKTPLTAGSIPVPQGDNYTLFGTRDTTKSQVAVEMTEGETYNVAVSAHDETGNYGPLSNVLQVKAVKTIDFWQAYVDAGGGDDSGCSTLPGSPLRSPFFDLLFLVAGAVLVSRRRCA